jgi:hypothetical protein
MNSLYSKPIQSLLVATAIAGLIVTLIPSFLNWQGILDEKYVNSLMMAGTILWFIPAILLFGRKAKENPESEVQIKESKLQKPEHHDKAIPYSEIL